MGQNILTIVCVVLASVYVIYSLWKVIYKNFISKDSSCGSCGSCDSSHDCTAKTELLKDIKNSPNYEKLKSKMEKNRKEYGEQVKG